MEHKNKSFSRIKRHQSDKVLRFSIRKYSFGAASVAVAALMFLGTHVVSADGVDDKNQPVIGAPNPNEEESPLIEPAPTAKNEETKKVEVAKETEEIEKPSENKEAVEANSLNNGTSTSTITVTKDASGDKVTEKQTLDKSQLQASITKVQELLDKVNKEKAPASTLAAIQADLENAKNALNNNELTQAEVDAAAKKLNEKSFVLSSMPKVDAPKKVVKEGENTIANTGSRDSRNNRSMGEGAGFRATTTDEGRVEGALINVKEYISEEKFGGGGVSAGQRTRTIDKTFMTAKYSQEDGKKYITYDVYFQNDGKALSGTTGNAFWFYPPRDLLYSGGSYPVGVVSDVYYERYQNNAGTGRLSDNPNNFTRVGDRYTVPLGRLASNSYQDSGSQGLWGAAGGLFQMSGGPTRDDQRQQMLKQLQHNEDLNRIIKLNNDPNGSYPGASYSHILTVSPNQNYAYKFHIKVRLKDNVTDAQAQKAGALAVTAKEGKAFNALQAYVYAATGTKLESRPDKQLYPIKGKEVTKTVGDSLGDVSNPVASDFVVRNDDTKNFPEGMRWSWTNGQPNTSTAGIFKYNVTATYSDNSSNSTTATLKVKPKTPVIEQSSVNEKAGKTGQNVVVTVQDGVPNGSTVTLYNGNTVIGTGRTNGQKATINVSGALPSTAISAKTTVTNNYGSVESASSTSVIPTPEPDRVAPTVKIVDKTRNNTETTLTDNVSTAPTIDVYRGANIELPLKYYDNNAAGKVNIQHVSGIPRGVWFNENASANSNVTIKESGKTENTQGSYTVRGRVDANAPLGISTVTLKVSDAANGDVNQGNNKEVKFRVRVLDLDFEQGVSEQTGAAKISREVELNRPVGDPNNYLTVNDGSQRNDRLFPSGMTFRYIRGTEYKTNLTYTAPGKYTEKAAAFYPTTYVPTNGESVTATNATGDNVNEIRGRAYVARDIEFQVKPTAPTVTPQENGDVIVSHTNQTNVNTLSFTYTNGNGAQQTVTATKNGNSWTLDNPSIDGVTIDANTGAVTIKDRAVGDASQVTAKVATSDSVNSNDTTATTKTGERIAPTFEFNSKYTEVVNGQRVVYVTPTENLSNGSITLGTVKDNSNKLLETVLFHGNGTSYNLEYGLTYNDKPRTNNGDFTAPHDIVITGTVPKINPNTNNIWENDSALVTRYVSAMDAAGNQLKNQSNENSNPLRVQFKILSQAAKYNPQVATQAINKDITANGARLSADEFNAIKSTITFTANKGDVKVAHNTPNMNITMNENGAVKRNSNGTYYVGATVNYPDGTSEVIQIPVEKSDKIPPTVKMNGKELTENAADNHFIIYRGANFNPTFEVNDNSGVTTYLKADGIPNGVWFNKQGNADSPKTGNMANKTQYQLTTNNTVDSTAPLGDREARVTVKDALNNEKTYKFKYTIVDVDVKDSPKSVRLNSQLGDPHHFLTTTATNRVNSDDQYFPGGMRFKWIKNNQEVAQTTTLPKSGTITDYKVVAEFANGARSYEKTIDGKTVTIYTPARVEKPVTLIVTEDSPPTVKMTNPSDKRTTELSGDDSNSPIVTIYRNGQLDIPLSFYDNEATGRVNLQYVEGLPKGVSFGGTNNTVSVTGAVANANGTHTISGRVAADATLGMSTVTMKVSDGANGVASGNQGEVKFRIRVLDVDFEEARSPQENQNSITVETNVGVSIPDPNHYLTVNDGTTRTDTGNFPTGMTFRYVSSDGSSTTRTLQYSAPGQYTVKARAYFPVDYAGTNGIGEVVSGQTGDNTEINGRRYIEKTIVFKVKPTTPVVAPQDNGDVTITQLNETNVNRLKVTYTTQGDNPQEVTYTASKNGDTWSFGSNVPISIDGATGTVKIKDRLVQDGSTVKATAIVSRDGEVASDEASGDAKPGDAIYPTIDFQNTETDAQGNRVVYITPTEDTNLDVATINDNSNKLLEAVFFDQGTTLTDLGNYGLTYNKVIRNGDTITNAPLTFTVRGTLNKIKSGSTLWSDDEVITTRYASAMDAAENNIKDKSGSRDNVASNPYRVVFKTLTQATKYTPTVSKSKIERDITQANTTITTTEFDKIKDTLAFSSTRGEVKVDKNTSGLSLAMKNSTVQTKQDGTLYITATVTYPDGSREDIEVPLDTTNANKAKPTLTIPEVSVKAAKAKGEQGSVPATEYNRVLNNVTVPQAQPQPTAKEVKNNGRISVVGGKNVVTVGLTFSDNTKKDVTVPVLEVKPIDITTTFNELDNTVTVKPNTTVENGDKLHVTIRGVGMQLTKTETGYTNSRNDRDITVNSDGSITISLLGHETFQAGDRVVTRHESNKNGKVDSYETEAFAGLKPVEKVPAINLTNLTPKEIEAVKEAVKKANPSVNVDELQVAANGDVTYTHRGEGVGENDPAQTFTLRDNVRPANNAERYNPPAIPQTVDNGTVPDAESSVDKTGLPSGTTVSWKTPPTVTTPGNTTGTAIVHYPDGSEDEVEVPITVKQQKDTYNPPAIPQTVDNGTVPDAESSVDKTGLPSGTTVSWKTPPTVTTPGNTTGTAIVHYPDGSEDEVEVPITVKQQNINGDPEVQPETPEYTGPISSNGVDENGNLIDPPVVDIPEFNGGVNGELPDPVELPKVKLIITKWVDEQGNELKPADAKAPAVLGKANEALEAGEIEGYVFVRTDVNEEGDVVTHIFRKVTPTKPEGNGGEQGGDNKPQPRPEVPTDNTEHKPETEKPTVPDTKQAEQPSQTVDGQVAPSQNQAVLPNTGTKADRATGALGALSLLGAFGLLFAKKKKDDEEETRNN